MLLLIILDHNVSKVKGIKGLSSGVFFDNLMPSFLEVRIQYNLCYKFNFSVVVFIFKYKKLNLKASFLRLNKTEFLFIQTDILLFDYLLF